MGRWSSPRSARPSPSRSRSPLKQRVMPSSAPCSAAPEGGVAAPVRVQYRSTSDIRDLSELEEVVGTREQVLAVLRLQDAWRTRRPPQSPADEAPRVTSRLLYVPGSSPYSTGPSAGTESAVRGLALGPHEGSSG